MLSGADAVGRAARALRGLGRLGDGDALPPRGARGRAAPRGAAFESSFFAYYEDVDLSLRLARAGWRFACDPRARRAPRGLAHRAPHAVSPRVLDARATAGARSFATSTPALLARSVSGPPARGPRARARRSAGRASRCRCSSGRGCRSRRCARGTSRGRLARWPRPAVSDPRDHGDPRLLEGRRRICSTAVASLAAARARIAPGGVAVSLVVVDNGGGAASEEPSAGLWPDAARARQRRRTAASARPPTRRPRRRAATSCSSSIPTRAPRASPSRRSPARFDADARVVAVAPRLVEMDGSTSPPRGAAAPGSARPRGPGDVSAAPPSDARRPTRASCCCSTTCAPNHAGAPALRGTPTRTATPRFAVEQAAAAALAVRTERVRARAAASTSATSRPGTRTWISARACGREGTILYVPGRALPAPRRRLRVAPRLRALSADLLPQRPALPPRPLRRRARALAYRAAARQGHAAAPGRCFRFAADVPRSRGGGRPRLPRACSRWPCGLRAVACAPDVSIIVVSKDDAADLPVSLGSAVAQRGVDVRDAPRRQRLDRRRRRECRARFGGAVRLLAHPRERRIRRRR